MLAITSFALVGFVASSIFAQEYYSQPVVSTGYGQIQGQVVYPQSTYPAYESVPTPYPVYSEPVVTSSYPQNVTYSSNGSAPVVYQSVPVYESNAQPIVESYPTATYASSQPITYSSAPAVSYPTGTYASNSYPTNHYSQPVTYTSGSVAPAVQPVTYAQPIYAQPVTYSQPTYSQPVTSYQPVARNYSTSMGGSYASTGNVSSGLAQQKAVQAAQMGLQGHLNNQLGGAKYEGVGWSNQSAQHAIQNCCYWGTRPTAQIGVSKAPNGTWYACVLYH